MKPFFYSLAVVFFLTPLHAEEGGNEHAVPQEKKVLVPDPLNLTPQWQSYYDVDVNQLPQRIEKSAVLLRSYLEQVPNGENKKEAALQVQKIRLFLDSYLIAKEQIVEKQEHVWLLKESYLLKEYIDISDQIYSLKAEIQQREGGISRLNSNSAETEQSLHNSFARYLSAATHSEERFLLGLKTLAKGIELLYLKQETRLAEEKLGHEKELLNQYQQESALIVERLDDPIDLKQHKQEREKISNDLSQLYQEEIHLKATILEQRKDKERDLDLIHQKLISVALKENLMKAKELFLDAKMQLKKVQSAPGKYNYEQSVGHISSLLVKLRLETKTSKNQIADDLDKLSPVLTVKNGEVDTEEKVHHYQEKINLMVSNRVLLDALEHQLGHITIVLNLIQQQAVSEEKFSGRILFNIEGYVAGVIEGLDHSFGYSLFSISGVPITLENIFKALVIILISLGISSLIGRLLDRYAKKRGRGIQPTIYTVRRIIHYILLCIGILFAFGAIGLTMHNIALVLGAVGIGVGLGLQNIVNNFFCGLSILFERNLRVGDIVELESGQIGKITEVNIQNTTLHTFDGMDVIVPNSDLIANHVINWTKKDSYLRLHVPFCVAYGTDQEKVSEIICAAALKESFTMRGKDGKYDPEVWLVKFGDNAIHFELVVWVNLSKSKGQTAMKCVYLSHIEKALRQNGMIIPFPQRDIYIKSAPEEFLRNSK